MTLLEINPYVRYVDKRDETTHYTDFVMSFDHRLFYVETGSFGLVTENENHEIHSNQLIILPPATKYKINFENRCIFTVVNFDLETEKRDITKAREPQPEHSFDRKNIISDKLCDRFPAKLYCDERTNELAQNLYYTFIDKNSFSDEYLSALLKLIITGAFAYTTQNKVPDVLKRIISYIDKNYSDRLSNQKLGELFSYHPNYLNRLFKTYTKKSLHRYIIDVRLSHSMYLVGENMAINEICKTCGFSSPSYFIKEFHKKYGVSPLKLRNQKKNLLP